MWGKQDEPQFIIAALILLYVSTVLVLVDCYVALNGYVALCGYVYVALYGYVGLYGYVKHHYLSFYERPLPFIDQLLMKKWLWQ